MLLDLQLLLLDLQLALLELQQMLLDVQVVLLDLQLVLCAVTTTKVWLGVAWSLVCLGHLASLLPARC